MMRTRMVSHFNQRGAAILLALLIMTVLATLASAAIATHWREQRTSAIVRANAQQDALLHAAVLWGQNMLVQDAISSKSDHLNEAWNQPVVRAPLAPFLGLPNGNDALGAFVSIRVVDLNRKWNILNLKRLGTLTENAMARHIALETRMSPERLIALAMNAPSSKSDAPVENENQHSTTSPSTGAAAQEVEAPEGDDNRFAKNAGYASHAFSDPHSSNLRLPNEPTACLRWLGFTNEEIERVQELMTCHSEDGLLNINTVPAQFLEWMLGPDVAKVVMAERSQRPFDDQRDLIPRLKRHLTKAQIDSIARQSWVTDSFLFAIEAEVTLDSVPWKVTQTVIRSNRNVFPLSTLLP